MLTADAVRRLRELTAHFMRVADEVLVRFAGNDVRVDDRGGDLLERRRFHRNTSRVTAQTDHRHGSMLAKLLPHEVFRVAPALPELQQPADRSRWRDDR